MNIYIYQYPKNKSYHKHMYQLISGSNDKYYIKFYFESRLKIKIKRRITTLSWAYIRSQT